MNSIWLSLRVNEILDKNSVVMERSYCYLIAEPSWWGASMAGLIKGQILKHLSKFVKNLSPSQINLSTLKGEGELSNLELNVEVLGELLELPSWIRLTRATCNRAAIRIQWTKLKTVPIQLSLDEIRVAVETCEELRSGGENVAPVLPPTQAYGFTEKIVDGITVTVNLVHVSLTSLAFTASFQMSRIVVESRGPNWQRAALPSTRLKDLEKGEVLTFKELSWQTVRIEARSSVQEDLTSLRLITNQARCRITLKKRISDCAILGARIVLILDDLLWVLTDDQLKAALHFIGSISGLVRRWDLSLEENVFTWDFVSVPPRKYRKQKPPVSLSTRKAPQR